MSVKVEGLKEAIKYFKKVDGDINDLKDAFQDIGTMVANKAKSLAPRRTGKLVGGIKPSRRQNMVQIVSGSVFYNKFVHFGTKHIKPNKYMYEAIDASEAQIVQAFTKDVIKVLEGNDG